MASDRQAVIVGGGIGGLAVAVALRRGSWQVTVLERHPSLSEIGAGITLWPNALRALDALGLGDVRSLGVVPAGGGMRDPRGKWLNRTDMGELGGDGILVLERRRLLGALQDAVAGDEGVAVRTGVTVVGVDARGVVDCASGEQICGDVVIGADGINSAVRRALWPQAKVRSTGIVAARLIGRLDDSREPGNGETWGRGDYAGVAPLPEGSLYAYYATRRTAEALAAPQDALPWWQRKFANWHYPLPQLLDAAEPDRFLCHELFELPPLDTLVRGQVALAGDAAHAMTPNLGQGACLALEDAVELAAALDGSAPVVTGLRDYERSRLPRVHRLAKRSHTAGVVAALSGRALTTFRNTLVRVTPESVSLRAFRSVADWRPPLPV
ncbi:FAD-dependent oxidoreductase [Amycolatopsis acidicola]|uniref:FAD-dependent oxidoreductase n=1 Tax=Amycolatopsis acidicola TaxID=2596893 RepID=A0A5N0V7D2_9PSEU|nr:FAD-dependent monooxygenase [Amycolatopsis acidicola]KAA9162326.1 FAD-dependent oxidoreductase [Amycolatopsis acidicola]